MLSKKNPGESVYQSGMQRTGGTVLTVIGALMGIWMLSESRRPGTAIIAVVFLALYVPGCFRFARSRIVAHPGEVLIANVFSTRALAWTEIERFEIGRWTVFPYVCLVRMRNGEVEHAFGIQERTNFPDGSAELIAEKLNEELAKWTGGNVVSRSGAGDSK
jgi:hypothetical protein